MSKERHCKRCQGSEYKVMASATLGGWPHVSPAGEHWYCPRCDWGRLAREEGEEILV